MKIEDRVTLTNVAQAHLTAYGYARDELLLEHLARYACAQGIEVTPQDLRDILLNHTVNEHFQLVSYFVKSNTQETLLQERWMIVFTGWAPFKGETLWHGLDKETHAKVLPQARD